MPRSVESIVDCHRAATALKAAGRSPWPYQVAIRPLLDTRESNVSSGELVETARGIAALLRSSLPPGWMDMRSSDFDRDLEELLEHFEQCTSADLEVKYEEPADVFDERLEELYDWADSNRVWLG